MQLKAGRGCIDTRTHHATRRQRPGCASGPRPRPSPLLLHISTVDNRPFQVFNEINCRRISDELNVFAQLHRSPIFIAVLAVTVGCQVIIIELLGSFFTVSACPVLRQKAPCLLCSVPCAMCLGASWNSRVFRHSGHQCWCLGSGCAARPVGH